MRGPATVILANDFSSGVIVDYRNRAIASS